MKEVFKIFWREPRSVQDAKYKRHITFLELFYDLAFVVFISRTNHIVINDWSGHGAMSYAPIIVIAYISWMNGSLYYDLHGNNDIRTRFFMFLQMFFIGLIARFTHHVLTDDYIYFAFSYGALQLILSRLWYSTGIKDENHRLVATPYSFTFLLSSIILIVSIFIPEKLRLLTIWVSIIITGSAPFFSYIKNHRSQNKSTFFTDYKISETLVERLGIFLIIILGECLVSLVSSLESVQAFTLNEIEYYVIGFLFMVLAWSNYYEYSNNRNVNHDRKSTILWYFGQLFLVIGYSMMGIALYYLGDILMFDKVIEKFNYALGLSTTFILLSSAIITLSLKKDKCGFGFVGNQISILLGTSGIISAVITILNPSTYYAMILQLIAFSIPVVVGFTYNITVEAKRKCE